MSRSMAVAALLAALAMAGAANAADKLVLQLHAPAQFEFAGYYAALWQGYYRDAGLDIEIKPGAGQGEAPIDPVRDVTEGRAAFGTGTAELVVRTGQGLPLLLLAPIFQASGAMVYYRADGDFASPAGLAKAKLGRLPASNILDIELATALKAEGVDPDKLASVPLEPGQSLAALADNRVDAVPGSAWDLPWLAQQKGIALKAFDPADYRVEFYGDTLFTLRSLAEREPQVVRQFRAASLKGWEYALQHPDEIAAQIVGKLPHPAGIADPAGFARYQAEIARRLARYPEIALGHSNPERWGRIEASMTASGALLRTSDADDFVYDPDAAARNRTDLRDFAIIGATLVGGLLVTLWLWLRWRRRPVQAASSAEAAAPAEAEPDVPAEPAEPAGPLPVDLNEVLARLERRIRQRAPRRVAFRLSLLGELWRCRADPQIVRNLVLDLVGAAVTDIKGSGELIVGTRNYAFDAASLADTPGALIGEFARVTVRDSGAGLSDEGLARVLDPATSPRPAAAAAAEALRPLGGFVRVESAEGIGTAIHLYFARLAEPAAPAQTPEKPPEKPAEAAA
ncbi:MAG TPA: ABC transporter substrate-binding protein [Stellaceae bacterium]|nr:ABC transporter substrate-binding protein [Stellaceae bacterium]